MSALDKVKKIEADIAALPKEYQALFQKEQTWAQAHPYIYFGALFFGGMIAGSIIQLTTHIL